jgi:hypothetical protein
MRGLSSCEPYYSPLIDTTVPCADVSSAFTASMCDHDHFRLLDLPVELRTLIYEKLSCTNRRHIVEGGGSPVMNGTQNSPQPIATGLTPAFPVAILATCRQIHLESRTIVGKILQRLPKHPKRLIMDTRAFAVCMFKPGRTAIKVFTLLGISSDLESYNPIEIILTRSNEDLSIHRIITSILNVWSTLEYSRISCTVFLQGVLPNFTCPDGTVYPGQHMWILEWRNGKYSPRLKAYKKSSMEVVEVAEGDWAKSMIEWEA